MISVTTTGRVFHSHLLRWRLRLKVRTFKLSRYCLTFLKPFYASFEFVVFLLKCNTFSGYFRGDLGFLRTHGCYLCSIQTIEQGKDSFSLSFINRNYGRLHFDRFSAKMLLSWLNFLQFLINTFVVYQNYFTFFALYPPNSALALHGGSLRTSGVPAAVG